MMTFAELAMALPQLIALLALKHLFWMQILASVMPTIILILQTQHIATKELANNAQNIKEITRDYLQLAIYVTLNGCFSIFFKYYIVLDVLVLLTINAINAFNQEN